MFTYEFHADRAQQARAEFEQMGLSPLITVHHCDVIANGFSRPQNSGKHCFFCCKTNKNNLIFFVVVVIVDAVFLDLPQPHSAIVRAAACLKPCLIDCFTNLLKFYLYKN